MIRDHTKAYFITNNGLIRVDFYFYENNGFARLLYIIII